MREETARTVSNVILGAAAIAAAVVVLRVPALRRVALTLARTAVTTTLPAWLAHETRAAWEQSGRSPRSVL